jgi:hypothetical protein
MREIEEALLEADRTRGRVGAQIAFYLLVSPNRVVGTCIASALLDVSAATLPVDAQVPAELIERFRYHLMAQLNRSYRGYFYST